MTKSWSLEDSLILTSQISATSSIITDRQFKKWRNVNLETKDRVYHKLLPSNKGAETIRLLGIKTEVKKMQIDSQEQGKREVIQTILQMPSLLKPTIDQTIVDLTTIRMRFMTEIEEEKHHQSLITLWWWRKAKSSSSLRTLLSSCPIQWAWLVTRIWWATMTSSLL